MEIYKITAKKKKRFGTTKYVFPKNIAYHNYYDTFSNDEYDHVLVSAILIFLTKKYISEKTKWQKFFYKLLYLIIEPDDNIVLLGDGRFVINKRRITLLKDYHYYLKDFYLDFDNNMLYHSDNKDDITILKRKFKINKILKNKNYEKK